MTIEELKKGYVNEGTKLTKRNALKELLTDAEYSNG